MTHLYGESLNHTITERFQLVRAPESSGSFRNFHRNMILRNMLKMDLFVNLSSLVSVSDENALVLAANLDKSG